MSFPEGFGSRKIGEGPGPGQQAFGSRRIDQTQNEISLISQIKALLIDPTNQEYLTDAHTIVPCGHVFRGHIAKRFLHCPTCYQKAEKAIPNEKIQSMVKLVQKYYGNK